MGTNRSGATQVQNARARSHSEENQTRARANEQLQRKVTSNNKNDNNNNNNNNNNNDRNNNNNKRNRNHNNKKEEIRSNWIRLCYTWKAKSKHAQVHFNQQLDKKIKQKQIVLYMNSQYNPNHYKIYVGQLGAVINNKT